MKPNIYFWGTPDFADVILRSIMTAGINISHVVTQPDRPSGRKGLVTFSPVKKTAIAKKIKILQPEKLKDKDFLSQLALDAPDLMIIAAYGKIIPKEVLDIPKMGAVNVHPSLLPKYRGASPVSAAILNGDLQTGVTLIIMDEKMDHGPILAQERWPITQEDTNETLHQKLAELSASMLIKTIPLFLAGKATAAPQPHESATFTNILTREDGRLDFSQPADALERKIRAYSPWPGTWSTMTNCRADIKGKKLIIHRATLPQAREVGAPANAASPDEMEFAQPGSLFFSGNRLMIRAGNASLLEVLELQMEGKKQISAADFQRGYSDLAGCILV